MSQEYGRLGVYSSMKKAIKHGESFIQDTYEESAWEQKDAVKNAWHAELRSVASEQVYVTREIVD